MTNEEMQEKMESLLKQQESLSVRQDVLQKQQEAAQALNNQHSEQIGIMMQAIVGLTAMTTTLTQRFEEAEVARREADQALKELAQRQKELFEEAKIARRETEQALKESAAQQAEQRERLDAFILVLERSISDRQHGQNGHA